MKPTRPTRLLSLTALLLAVVLLISACGPALPSGPSGAPETEPSAALPGIPSSAPAQAVPTSAEPPAPSAAPTEPAVVNVDAVRDLMEGITARAAKIRPADETFRQSQLSFALELARAQAGGRGNLLISPLSVMTALAMTANGAAGENLRQMEQVLGSGMPIAQLNEYLSTYLNGLPSAPNARFTFADSVWLRSDITASVVPEFLQTNADYYDAAVYAAPFTPETVARINDWVSEKTDKMIPKLVDQLGRDTVMVLLNALVFDARWASPYEDSTVSKGSFRTVTGLRPAEFMTSTEPFYLQAAGATGFLKTYEGGTYAFAGLLPAEGQSPEELLKELTAQELGRALASPERAAVRVRLPKFSYDWEGELSPSLQTMGMPAAFSAGADFSRMLPGAYISQVIHKTRIEVTQDGTRAAAVTAVIVDRSVSVPPAIQYTVTLDRPFVYMIIDMQTRLPVFLGIVNDIAS
ncbi:MAG: serpin family protein [Lachnospiraceae bacterium]|nr:serpin family protein [Lachnospiraceae bacterium]